MVAEAQTGTDMVWHTCGGCAMSHLPWHCWDAQAAAQGVLVSHSREEGAAGASLIGAEGVSVGTACCSLWQQISSSWLCQSPYNKHQDTESESPCVLWLLLGCLQSQQVQ